MSRVRSTSGATALVALLALAWAGVARAEVTAQPVSAGPVVAALASPVLVPPLAPVDLTVRAPGPPGQAIELQELRGDQWLAIGRTALDATRRARFRVTRGRAGTYTFRGVLLLRDPAAVASEPVTFSVTTTGLGDPRAYAFLYRVRGVPARWNPCAEVTYRVHLGDARKEFVPDLTEALRRITYETGVRFRYLGTTAGVPGSVKGFRYDADAVIAWSHPGESTLLDGSMAGVGGFEHPVPGRRGGPRIAHGFVVLDGGKIGASDVEPGFGEGTTEGEALLHELGHMMGLDHVHSADQVMRPTLEPMRAALYGAGDLAGLRRLGRRSGCL